MARRFAFAVAILGFAAHAASLLLLNGASARELASDSIQFLLGVGATWAAVVAAQHSGLYARKVWLLAAIGLGTYTAGQAIVIYYDNFSHAALFSPWISDQFLFFWVVPLGMAALIDRWAPPEKFDWAVALDFGQVFLIALALHLSVFALASAWVRQGQQLAFLEWKVRMLRDAIVLTALASKVLLSTAPKTRSLFARLLLFFGAYCVADVVYLYAEAQWSNRAGNLLDLVWSLPRVLLICGALTWKDEPQPAQTDRPRTRLQTLPLHMASILGPLCVALVGLRIAGSSPSLAATLVLLSFAGSGVRLLITQDRQERIGNELRASRDLLEAIVEGTSEAIYVRDREGKYEFVNHAACRVLGKSSAEILGRSNYEFFTSVGAERIRETDEQIIHSGQPQSFEESLTLNGARRTFLSQKAPYRDSQGNIAGVLGIAIDVTEQRKMEEALRKAQRMESIGTLAGGVAHDFNNLLTIIKGYSQLLLSESNASSTNDALVQIDKAADKASSLTRQLLAFSRQQVMQPAVLNLNDVVRDLEKMLRRLLGEDIRFVVWLAPDLQNVLADRGQIEQVIMNLAANARDAMPQGGELSLVTENCTLSEGQARDLGLDARNSVCLKVADTGEGMDEATQARIFEPFFTTKAPGKGTGLGLSTVYGIVSQSEGAVSVESQAGRGSTFSVFFPATKAGDAVQAPEVKKAARGNGRETVLVVEDETTLSKLVETSLKTKGYEVLVAHSGDVAEKIAREHSGPIHLVLSDVIMPHASGPQVTERICELRPEARVIWMSGYTDEKIAHHGVLAPGVHFLQKPFTPNSLAEKVREVLDKQ